MQDMTQIEIVEEARQAFAVLSNPIIAKVLKDLETEIMDGFARHDPDDHTGFIALQSRLMVLRALKEDLQLKVKRAEYDT